MMEGRTKTKGEGAVFLWYLFAVRTFLLIPTCCSAKPSVPITVVIQYDRNPDETSWSLQCGVVVHVNHTSSIHDDTLSEKLVVETYQVQQEECNFTTTDNVGDGLCCNSGNGWYQLFFGDGADNALELIVEGGEFDLYEEVIFEAELSAPASSPVPSYSPSLAPSLSPSQDISAASSTSAAPTLPRFPVTIVIQLDMYPEETSWTLQCEDGLYAYIPSPTYAGQQFERIEETFQIPEGMNCMFSIHDLYGDGVCCGENGDGFFQVLWGLNSSSESRVLTEGGEFGSREVFSFVALPLAPTSSPAPSMSPSFKPSLAPSASPAPTIYSECNINDLSNFDICVDSIASGNYTTDWTILLADAMARWESIIAQDTNPGIPASELESLNVPVCTSLPSVVDDIYVCATEREYDGPGGILGGALITATDSANGLPIAGYMAFDKADIQSLLDSGKFADLLLHEAGHLLGIGQLWESFDLTVNVGTYYTPQWVYIGARACEEWRNITNCGGCPPVENRGVPGFISAHWDEGGLDHELMTGLAEKDGELNPLSRISIGSLEDMGYAVDYGVADEFSFANLTCPGENRRLHTSKPKISSKGMKSARHHGQKLLAEGKKRKPATIGGGAVYTADQHVSVMYMEKDKIFFVDVHAKDY